MSDAWGPRELPPLVFTLGTTGRDYYRWLQAGGLGEAPRPWVLSLQRVEDAIYLTARSHQEIPSPPPVGGWGSLPRPDTHDVIVLDLRLDGEGLAVSGRIVDPDEDTDWRDYLALLAMRSLQRFPPADRPVPPAAPVEGVATHAGPVAPPHVSAQSLPVRPEPLARPSPPARPGAKDGLDAWFTWYHAMRRAGFKCTLGDVAEAVGLSSSHVKHQHAEWLQEHGPLGPQ